MRWAVVQDSLNRQPYPSLKVQSPSEYHRPLGMLHVHGKSGAFVQIALTQGILGEDHNPNMQSEVLDVMHSQH